MSAMATKKPNSDRNLQLTFPVNFSAAFNGGISYFPSDFGEPMQLMVGKAFQSEYHEEKRLQANQSVMNGIQNKRSAERLLLTGPHNYHLPKPVLGQRKFANPSMGVVGFSSARRDQEGSPFTTIEGGREGGMRGGVVTSREGYDFYKNQLNSRIGELNNINAVAQGYSVPAGQSLATYDNTKNGSPSKVTLFLYIRALGDAITEGQFNRFTIDNLKELLGLLSSFTPDASEDDLNDMMDEFEVMLNSMRSFEPDVAEYPEKITELTVSTKLYLERIFKYVSEMLRNIHLSVKDKTTLSKSLYFSLFGKLIAKKDLADLIQNPPEDAPRFGQEAANLDDGDIDGAFDEEAPVREDEEQGNTNRQPLAGNNGDPERERFGSRRGTISQADTNYFGEGDTFGAEDADVDATGDGVVAPLGSSGDDPNAVPRPNLSPVVEALKAAIETAFGDLLTAEEKSSMTLSEQVALKFPAGPEQFIGEVLTIMKEKGYSDEQIIGAVAVSDGEIRDFFVNEVGIDLAQAGDLQPEPIRPAVRIEGQPVIPPAVAAELAAAARQPAAVSESARLASFGLPATREVLRAYATTIAKVREVAARVPQQYGSYKPRDGTTVKNAVAQLILLIRKVSPSF